jgi:hypothetical protein
LLSLLFAVVVAGAADCDAATSCTQCHTDAQHVGSDLADVIKHFDVDVHSQVGLSCHDCHGGDPAEELADDKEAAKAADRGYRGVPPRSDIPAFCGRCHSSPEYMKRFRPDARVDQEREYWTSHHGKLLRDGDEKVATCTDCHGVHGIRRPSDPQSSVYPTHVAGTCRGCHADPARMAGYTLDDGRPLPVDQYERWARSVHAAALLEKEDLSAPTCNDCHGNHGAGPPGLQSIGFVCGQCHGREAELFRASPKKEGFASHNEFLESTGESDEPPCASCHDSEPPGKVEGVHHFGECTTCHGNHAIIRPTMAMLGPLPATPCEFCHASQDAPDGLIEPSQQQHFKKTRDGLLEIARHKGLEGDALFDWLVGQARILPQHTEKVELAGSAAAMKPEFRRLFEKFRIGATHFTYEDPVTGDMVEESIIRCTSCHGTAGAKDDDATTASASAIFLNRMKTLTTSIARAERLLLQARRGGVATGKAAAEIDGAVDAQIELEVLVHSFSTGDDGVFAQTAAEGMEHARAATELGIAALDELQYRRKGLAASLGIVLVVLVALWLKIRDLTRRREDDEHIAPTV